MSFSPLFPLYFIFAAKYSCSEGFAFSGARSFSSVEGGQDSKVRSPCENPGPFVITANKCIFGVLENGFPCPPSNLFIERTLVSCKSDTIRNANLVFLQALTSRDCVEGDLDRHCAKN